MVVRSLAAVCARAERPVNSIASRAMSRATATCLSRRNAPGMTLSSTVMAPNGFATWKVRARPKAQMSCGLRPTISRPKASTEPWSGRWKPVMRWKLVVLPAPFGPIRASVSFSFTVKLTSCTARRPPNRLLRPRITSASAMAVPLRPRRFTADIALPGLAHHSHQPGRPPEDHGHQDQAVHGQLHAADRTAEPALQQRRRRLQKDGADHRTPQRADPADDRHKGGLEREAEAKGG